jgi:hypothetical protein
VGFPGLQNYKIFVTCKKVEADEIGTDKGI